MDDKNGNNTTTPALSGTGHDDDDDDTGRSIDEHKKRKCDSPSDEMGNVDLKEGSPELAKDTKRLKTDDQEVIDSSIEGQNEDNTSINHEQNEIIVVNDNEKLVNENDKVEETPANENAASSSSATEAAVTNTTESTVAVTATTGTVIASTGSSKKRGRSSVSPAVIDSVTVTALATASQYSSAAGWHGLSSLLLSALAPTASFKQLLLQDPSFLLHQSSSSSSINSYTNVPFVVPTSDVVQTAAIKACNEQPPWVHWSKGDIAPQLKIVDGSYRLQVQGAMRGYRMARASHGVSISKDPFRNATAAGGIVSTTTNTNSISRSLTMESSSSTPPTNAFSTISCYYYECIVLPGPKATEILKSLPPNARLGPGLREQLQKNIEWEKESSTSNSAEVSSLTITPPPKVGGHVRVGWSMRTGDLQAPVGYDKWSYGIRDQGGSIIHSSQRQDHWGGLDCSEPGTVIGCLISLDSASSTATNTHASNVNTSTVGSPALVASGSNAAATSTTNSNDCYYNNHIRFFKNGECMGSYTIDEETGKMMGGEAFTNIELGTYYPAVSLYMGGSVQTNFGPYWIYPPTKRVSNRLPPYVKQRLQPVCALCPKPIDPDIAVKDCLPTSKLFRSKPEHQNAFKEAIRIEAEIQYNSYQEFYKNHLKYVRRAREERSLSTQDLPDTVDETIAVGEESSQRGDDAPVTSTTAPVPADNEIMKETN